MNKLNIKNALRIGVGDRTQAEIAILIMPEKSPGRARSLFSRWANGHDFGALKPEHIVRMCQVLKVTPSQLFEWESKEKAIDFILELIDLLRNKKKVEPIKIKFLEHILEDITK